jgi:hypothetical protein
MTKKPPKDQTSPHPKQKKTKKAIKPQEIDHAIKCLTMYGTFAAPTSQIFAVATSDMGFHDIEVSNKKAEPMQTEAYVKPNNLNNPRTQKAKGVMRLVKRPKRAMPLCGIVVKNQRTHLLPYSTLPEDLFKHGPVFARPCPLTPRHGFVDSRPVQTMQEIKDLYEATIAADPMGELLIMPFATARYSAVVTHAGATWSLGNDGATGTGKPTRFVPAPCAASTWNQWVTRSFLGCYAPSDIGVKTAAYMEIVEDADWSRLVQMRDGPEQTTAANWVPVDGYKVENVHVLEGEPDLLEWEAAILALAKKPGPVLFAPGLGMSSHYAVHAIASNIPVITTGACPEVGATLHIEGAKALTDFDYRMLARASMYWSRAGVGMHDWHDRGLPFNPDALVEPSKQSFTSQQLSADFHLARCLAATAVGGLHAVTSWGNEPHLIDLRAFCAWALVRMLVAACGGELRHWYRCGPGGEREPSIDWALLGTTKEKCMTGSEERVPVHTTVFGLNGPQLMAVAQACTIDFRSGWGSSFGGWAWHESAILTGRLITALLTFEAQPTAENWGKVLALQNQAVHAAHNGGVLLDKWLPTEEMNLLSSCPSLGFANALIGGYLAQQCQILADRKKAGEAI